MDILVALYVILYGGLLLTSRREPLLFLRLAFLGAPGLVCAVALQSGWIISVYMPIAQTPELMRQAVTFSAIGLISARLGWTVGAALAQRKRVPPTIQVLDDLSVKNIVIIVFLVVVTWYAEGKGGTIFSNAYANRGANLPLGNLNSIINIILAVVMYFYLTNRTFKYMWNVLFAVIAYKIFYANLIRGIRMDALDTLVMIFVLLGVYREKFSQIRVKYVLAAVIFLFILQAVGGIRNSFFERGFADFWSTSFTREVEAGTMLSISTIGPITATFLGLMYLADLGYSLPLSRTYLGWVLRIPPEFVYPERPDDISSIFAENGLVSGGGSFELGEAFLTMGLIGVVLVPLVISGVFAFLLQRLKKLPHSLVLFVLLASMLAVFSRGGWYQSFAYFKSYVTGLIILVPLLTITKKMGTARRLPSPIKRKDPVSRANSIDRQLDRR